MSFEWHKKLIFACLSLQSKRRVIEKVAVTVTFQWSRCRPFPVITALRLQQHCMLETTINNIKQKFLECNTTHISVNSQYLAIECFLQAIVLKNHIWKKKYLWLFVLYKKFRLNILSDQNFAELQIRLFCFI